MKRETPWRLRALSACHSRRGRAGAGIALEPHSGYLRGQRRHVRTGAGETREGDEQSGVNSRRGWHYDGVFVVGGPQRRLGFAGNPQRGSAGGDWYHRAEYARRGKRRDS